MKFYLALLLVLAPAPRPRAAVLPRTATTPFETALSGAGQSAGAVLSDDGSIVVFLSVAPNLVPAGGPVQRLQVVVRQADGSLFVASRSAAGGAEADASDPALSADGRWVAFASAAGTLAPGDTNGLEDVFIRAVGGGRLELVSMAGNAAAGGNGGSRAPSLSADGRFVVFESTAGNLVTNDFNQVTDVFLRDRANGRTELVSVAPTEVAGGGEAPMISRDGRVVAYAVRDAIGFGERPVRKVRVWDRSTGLRSDVGLGLTNRIPAWALSADGSRVAFAVGGPMAPEVYSFDTRTGVRERIGALATENDPLGISADGFRIALGVGTNLLVIDGTATVSNVAAFGGAPAAYGYRNPVFSADGRVLCFLASPRTLGGAPVAAEAAWQLYSADLVLGTVSPAAVDLDGAPAVVDPSTVPAVSADGHRVAFDSPAANLVAGDHNRASDVFLAEDGPGSLELVSRAHGGGPARTSPAFVSHPPSLSDNGRYLLFRSFDSTLVQPGPPGSYVDQGVTVVVGGSDTNGHPDLFVRDLWNDSIRIVPGSYGTNVMAYPRLSGDGSTAVFWRLWLGGGNRSSEARYDLLHAPIDAGKVAELTITDFIEEIERHLLSSARVDVGFDGRLVAYASQYAPDRSGSPDRQCVVVDTISRRSFGIPCAPPESSSFIPPSSSPVLSRDSRWLVYPARSPGPGQPPSGASRYALDVADLGADPDRPNLTNPPLRRISLDAAGQPLAGDITNAMVSANSRHVVFTDRASWTTYRHDLLAPDAGNLLVATNARNASISADGRWVVYETVGSGPDRNDLRLHDCISGTDTLVTRGLGGGGANGASFGASLAPDGRVLFVSRASNLVPGDSNRVSDIFLYDPAAGGVMLVSRRPDGGAANGPSLHPVLSADGSTAAFMSFANNLIDGDFNERSDIFVVMLGGGDSDHDGLDDSWEMTYFGSLSRDGTGDADGDGATDAMEFTAGTDPTNAGSLLRVVALRPAAGGLRTLLWPAQAGVGYELEYLDALGSGVWRPVPGQAVLTGSTATQTDPDSAAAGRRFYRVKVRR